MNLVVSERDLRESLQGEIFKKINESTIWVVLQVTWLLRQNGLEYFSMWYTLGIEKNFIIVENSEEKTSKNDGKFITIPLILLVSETSTPWHH